MFHNYIILIGVKNYDISSKIHFGDNNENEIKIDLNLWYQSESEKKPFEYKIRENKKKMIIEEFPLTLFKNTYVFHIASRILVKIGLEPSSMGAVGCETNLIYFLDPF